MPSGMLWAPIQGCTVLIVFFGFRCRFWNWGGAGADLVSITIPGLPVRAAKAAALACIGYGAVFLAARRDCQAEGWATLTTCTAVTLYSGQFVAQSEFSVVMRFAPDSGK